MLRKSRGWISRLAQSRLHAQPLTGLVGHQQLHWHICNMFIFSYHFCGHIEHPVGWPSGVYLTTVSLQSMQSLITPRAHARARGYVIGRGVYILYIYYILLYICKTFFLSFKILTFRRPFQHRKASLRI